MEDPPSVLVILVVKDGSRWLKDTLASLARQTHPRLGILAVDNASTDGSREQLERLLGANRVLTLERNLGFPAAVGRALGAAVAREADFLLFLHDDTVLAPTTVQRLVEAADRPEVGVVGPKILDTERLRVVRDVGGTMDRFGYPSTPLEEDEIDLGQYDSQREVLYVSSAAMLVARDAWLRAGPPDERLRPAHADLDFCWRVRIAGFRVLMDPRAVAHHRSAGDRGERPGVPLERGRYFDERSAFTAMLKNYRLVTLLWVLPLFLAQGAGKVALFLLSRRFSPARQVLAAWGWALLRLPGTIRRRVRVQATRVVPDREVARFMAPTSTRMRRWLGQASSVLFPRAGSALDLDDDAAIVPVRERVRGAVVRYPAGLALLAGVVVSLISFRHVLFASPLEGGSLPVFPGSASELLARWVDGWVPGSFAGPARASPALVPLGLGGALTLGNPRIFAWVMVAAAPLAAGILGFRAMRARVGERGASIAGAVSYALSAVAMWAVSEGRLPAVVFVVALPWLATRLIRPFDEPVERPAAWIAITAIGIGIVGSFLPSVWAPLALLVLVGALLPGGAGSRGRGLLYAAAAAAGAAVLVFPFALELVRAGLGSRADLGIGLEPLALFRLSPGPAPGSWYAALFLPVAGALGFALARDEDRRRAWRAALAAAASIPLAWLAAAGYLPGPAEDPTGYLVLAAFAFGVLVALGFRAVVPGVERHAFGARQLAFAALVFIVGGGVLLQVAQALVGGWAVREDRMPPAYPVVRTAGPDAPSRVLWLGRVGSGPFPYPGGPPEGVVEARAASVRYAVTGRAGRSVLSVGLPASGEAYDRLERALRSILVGRIRHGGSILAPFGIGFVVAAEDGLPEAAAERLDAQLDLLPAQRAGGLVLYRNARAFPVGALLPGGDPAAARAGDVLAPARLPRAGLTPLRRARPGGWIGGVGLEAPGLVLLSTEFDPDWRLRAGGAESGPFEAFGWSVGFEAPAAAPPIRLDLGGTWTRTVEVAALALIWAGALWLASRGRSG